MEALPEHMQEISYRYDRAAGLEVQFVWDSVIEQAYSKVYDHNSGEQFNSIAPEGIHPKETFDHPFIYKLGSTAIEPAIQQFYADIENGAEDGRGSN
jgi:hypothetical protein